MKNIIAVITFGIVFGQPTFALDMTNFSTENPDVYGRQLVEHSDRYLSGWVDEVVYGEMSLFDVNNNSVRRTFTRMGYERFKKGNKSIIKFTSPAEIKGVSALNFENVGSSDDNWLYLPSTKKVRRISGANNTASFQGSEFTYEDLNDLDPEEYQWTFLAETVLRIDDKDVPVYKIDAVPTYKDTAYSHVLLYLHKDNWSQVKVEYFDKSESHLKTKFSSAWIELHGKYWRAKNVEMTNHQTGKRTVLKFDNYYLDLSKYKSKKTKKQRTNLREDMFTRRALES